MQKLCLAAFAVVVIATPARAQLRVVCDDYGCKDFRLDRQRPHIRADRIRARHVIRHERVKEPTSNNHIGSASYPWIEEARRYVRRDRAVI